MRRGPPPARVGVEREEVRAANFAGVSGDLSPVALLERHRARLAVDAEDAELIALFDPEAPVEAVKRQHVVSA